MPGSRSIQSRATGAVAKPETIPTYPPQVCPFSISLWPLGVLRFPLWVPLSLRNVTITIPRVHPPRCAEGVSLLSFAKGSGGGRGDTLPNT